MVFKAAGAMTVIFDIIDAPTNVEVSPEKKGKLVDSKTMKGAY